MVYYFLADCFLNSSGVNSVCFLKIYRNWPGQKNSTDRQFQIFTLAVQQPEELFLYQFF